ncbi:carbonyl reductase [NADPH] 1, partial [Parasteatoda tepidariorum]|uniref:carbonyl reductase [NADPH] 1 n=1 Tax=Parasteatoda tepidariorum TaxID=114398 RepID=UPI0039BC9057
FGFTYFSRVVNLSSSAGLLHRIPGKELQQRFLSESLTEEELSKLMNEFVEAAKAEENVQKGWGESAYVVSKNGVNALTFIQHRKFSQDPDMDIVINAVSLCKKVSFKNVYTFFFKYCAEASVYCALLPPGVESPRGEFIWNDKKITPWFS